MAILKRNSEKDSDLDLDILLSSLKAFAAGDYSKRMPTDWTGIPGEIAATVNEMFNVTTSLTEEMLTVLRAVGESGLIDARISTTKLQGTRSGVMKALNTLLDELVTPLNEMVEVIDAISRGDLSQGVSTKVNGRKKEGRFLVWTEMVNDMIQQISTVVNEISRVTREVGIEGKLGGRLNVPKVSGIWKELTENVDSMTTNLTHQVRDIAKVTTAVTNGDLSHKVTADARGEFLQLKETVNTQVDRLNDFAIEVSRVAREVGTEGKLGGQAYVSGVSGIWKELTDNVNLLTSNLTNQVRGIATVITAIAHGDLKKKINLQFQGEMAELADTINDMTETLALFANQVTTVAREVGTDGKLGGQARVPGVAGTWKDLTDNVNLLAANLTNQVRAIAEVATAVADGDLTRTVVVDAFGEVAELKDDVNGMIQKLRDNTIQNAEQDWLKGNLARFARVLQGHNSLIPISQIVLSELASLMNVSHGIFYILDETNAEEPRLKMMATYAYKERKNLAKEWKIGEGIVGQCAFEKTRILLTNVPSDYIQISSGLGEAKPLNILVFPILFDNRVKAVIELASFTQFSLIQQTFLEQLSESIGIVLTTIEANVRTEVLLKQSESLTDELQSQQEELRATNQELEEKAQLLEEQKLEVEVKNREVEYAKNTVEEKAEQLALTSKYKSEFLSNMSHELRTPLNSLLILAEHLAENPEKHLDSKEVEFAKLIHVSGSDLLALINEILDLSKIESGTVVVDITPVRFSEIKEHIEKTFQHIAQDQKLDLVIDFSGELPTVIFTDEVRLLQVMKNLISNAFKFTEKGSISVNVNRTFSGWNPENISLESSDEVIAFTVRDTGIGISPDKQRIIFEAFQQGDGETARKYGGTGLGLSISREIAHLLGGELALSASSPQNGSTFTLYLPINAKNTGILAPPRTDEKTSQSGTLKVQDRPLKLDTGNDPTFSDDRSAIEEGDRVLLIIEDDLLFAKIILDLAREKGFKGVISTRGAQALSLARSMKFDAITLDIQIPDVDGWAILDILKRDPDLRHIPIDVITIENNPIRALSLGAFHYLTKPATQGQIGAAMDATRAFIDRPVKSLLLVTSDKNEDKQITELLGNGDVTVRHVSTGESALHEMEKESIDCVVVGSQLSDMKATEFISALRVKKLFDGIPVVMFNEVPLGNSDRLEFEKLSASGIVRNVDSLDHLLDQTALFLHRVVSRLPKEKRTLLQKIRQSSNNLSDKKVLIVDDDSRNIIALTAALAHRGAIVSSAENGAVGIDLLTNTPDISIVLMDIMMPTMDGYETMRRIREMKKFKKLPIIALTAKAMVGDREKCIEAGASDYLSKPVNIEQLVSLMQIWLSK
ncbi:MAG: response regulator [Actinomycetota bacterium]